MTVDEFRTAALRFEEAVETPHFHLTSWRIRKKIFATWDESKGVVMIPLSPVEQSVFVNGDSIRPVPGAWGTKGATHFDLDRVDVPTIEHALRLAYRSKAPGRLAEKFGE